MFDEDVRLHQIQHLNRTGQVYLIDLAAYGAYSEVYRGKWHSEKGVVEVAIKQLRILTRESSPTEKEVLNQRFYKEILVWDRLRHENILPLLGFSFSENNLPWLISPWYPNENIVRYLRAKPHVQRLPLLLQIAQGLVYLHSLPLIHGDLKGDNVLVDEGGSARICDFGMSKFIDDTSQITGFTSSDGLGTPRFLCLDTLKDIPKSKKSDVWTFGCVAIQVLIDQLPYPEIQNPHAIRMAIYFGQAPLSESYKAEDSFWNGIRQCWNADPASRPDMKELSSHIQTALLTNGSADTGSQGVYDAFGKSRQPLKRSSVSEECVDTVTYDSSRIDQIQQLDEDRLTQNGSVQDIMLSSPSGSVFYPQQAQDMAQLDPSHNTRIHSAYHPFLPSKLGPSSSDKLFPHPAPSYEDPHLSPPPLSSELSMMSNYSNEVVFPSTDPSPRQRDVDTVPDELSEVFGPIKSVLETTDVHDRFDGLLFSPITFHPVSPEYASPPTFEGDT